ncbi:glycerol-3-phosphate dehydrogenase/oxidase [Pusillimonas noertemannii]|uniref:Glycerol-3-phosphate dehydrogenase n=1 Tax=Pusillimonas noertemannii TaxID=305977 RepID=A0A2U1CSL6_9BURK|nr:glycerol-3-phosphate dehydrogenase/oxidase [Pusillimonas noertemannii]PVY68853.1 glycerol-3-phosphate dehydrogenase [Pusillimonas noertemannii]
MLDRLEAGPFDLVVVGGGATGLGVALDAALRGLKVALLESHDFAKGTSSRATKLVHGGVRYLAQGRIGLVRESLRERTALLHNAPALVRPLPFVVPAYRLRDIPFYTAGLGLYDMLAGHDGLGATRVLSRRQTESRLPGIRPQGLVGGVEYWDAQFDDARLAVALARSAEAAGAVMLNYVRVTGLVHELGKVTGLRAEDTETGRGFLLRSRCVINATGVWSDELRHVDARSSKRPVRKLIRASRGTHLAVDRAFLPSDRALLVPRTADKRVLFAVPWLGKVLLGTTDVATEELAHEPRPDPAEIDYILREAGRYLSVPPARKDIRSAWAGLRPLVDTAAGHGGHGPVATRRISREHSVEVSPTGLVTVAGGKWTTYRAMAQDTLQACGRAGLLATLPPCRTQNFILDAAVGERGAGMREEIWASSWGSDGRGEGNSASGKDEGLPGDDEVLRSAGLTPALVRHAARCEYARRVEDVLARRSRLLFLDAALAARVAPAAARILQSETGLDPALDDFLGLARRYALAE